MIAFIKNKFAVSDKGAKGLVWASFMSLLLDFAIILPMMAAFYVVFKFYGTTPHGAPSPVVMGLCLVLGIIILLVVNWFQYASLYVSTYAESADVRITLSENLRKLPLSYFSRRMLSDITETILNDVTMLESLMSHVIPQFAGSVLSVTLIAFMVLFDTPLIALALFWVIPASVIFLVANTLAQQKLSRETLNVKVAFADTLQNAMDNIQEIKSYGATEKIVQNLKMRSDDVEKSQRKLENKMTVLFMLSKSILKLGIVSVVLAGTWLYYRGEMEVFKLVAYIMMSSMIYESLFAVYDNLAGITVLGESTKRIKEINDCPHPRGDKTPEIKNFDIEFKNVSFSYEDDDKNGGKALKDVSFVAKQGEVTALVGPSGSGKSTISKLVARFWDTNQGKITIGGNDVMEMTPEHLLKHISIVFQDVTLFNQSVKDNIRVGRSDATDEEVLEVARLARCDEFVARLPEGYDTVIGENGELLSGGERQRISIARALLKNAPIILLDEATASIDSDNETRIQRAISELIKDKTVLVIAHRMRTVKNAHKVVVLKEGSIIETGSPAELMKKEDGVFRRMTELQQKASDWSVL